MANDLRIMLAAAAFAAAGLAHSNVSAQSTSNTPDQSNLRERIAAAVEMIEGACATDVRNFCGNVTRGEGRLVLCMQAYDDQLSKRCQFALYRVSRNLGSVLSRVDRIADACWNDIQEKCGDADKIGQCVMEKRTSLSQPCQTVINDLQQAYQGLAALRGLPVHSSDDKELGQVVEVNKSPDGKIQSIQLSSIGGLDSAPKLSPLPLTNSSKWPIGLNYASGVKMFSRCRTRLKNRLASEPSRRLTLLVGITAEINFARTQAKQPAGIGGLLLVSFGRQPPRSELLSAAPNPANANAADSDAPHANPSGSVVTAQTHAPVPNAADADPAVVARRRVPVAHIPVAARSDRCDAGSIARFPARGGLVASNGKERRGDHQGGGKCLYSHLITPFSDMNKCQLPTRKALRGNPQKADQMPR